MLIKSRVGRFTNRVFRSRAGLWIPGLDLVVPKQRNVLAVIDGRDGRRLVAASNIVTDAGDQYYAQKAVGEAPATSFANLYLSSVDFDASHPAKGSTSDNLASVITGSEKAPSTGYPKTNDADADNTGAGVDVITWLYEHTKADFNDSDIDAGAIAAAGVTSWGGSAGSDDLLTGFDLTAFAKTADDTLKVFVNHTQNGV